MESIFDKQLNGYQNKMDVEEMKTKVSIKDVAEKANVSIATVSRVFNGYKDVSQKTKEKVYRIANELNYVPNVAARELSSKKFIKIALIINELEINRKNAIMLDALTGVYRASKESNIEFILIFTTEDEQKEKSLRDINIENNIAGAILQGFKITDPYFKEIQEVKIPIALIDITYSTDTIFSVSVDNIQASYDAVSLLIRSGHKKIGMITGRPEAMVTVNREAGYIKCLQEHHLEIKEEFIVNADFNEDLATEKVKELIHNYPEMTAIFVISDLMAIGAMKGLREIGHKIPEDISIIGFDDIILAEYTNPPLTTVHQSISDISYKAFKLLVEKIKDKKVNIPESYVRHSIIERESVKNINR